MAEPVKQVDASREQQLVARLLQLKDATGANVRKLARELFPDAAIPSEDAATVIETEVKPLKEDVDGLKTQLTAALERIAAREKADTDLQAENAMSVKLVHARKQFGLTDAGYDKMLARMKETGNVTDADAAAAWVVSQMPKPEPTNTPSWLPESSNLFGSQQKDEQFESLHKDPRKYLDDQLREFVRDPDKYVNDTFGTA